MRPLAQNRHKVNSGAESSQEGNRPDGDTDDGTERDGFAREDDQPGVYPFQPAH